MDLGAVELVSLCGHKGIECEMIKLKGSTHEGSMKVGGEAIRMFGATVSHRTSPARKLKVIHNPLRFHFSPFFHPSWSAPMGSCLERRLHGPSSGTSINSMIILRS